MTIGAAVWWALVAVEATALVLAASLTRAVRSPLVMLLAVALVNELTVEALHHFIFTSRLHPVAEAVQRIGWPARALYHLETALVLGWPAALAAATWRVFTAPRWHPTTRRRILGADTYGPRLLLGAWLGTLLALVYSYPLAEEPTRAAFVVFEVATVGSALVVVARSWRNAWTREHVAVGLLVASEVAVVAIGPWLRDPFRDWNLATVGYLTGFGALTVYLGASGRWRYGVGAAEDRSP